MPNDNLEEIYVVITIKDNISLDFLCECGVEIQQIYGNNSFCRLPLSSLDILKSCDKILKIDFPEQLCLDMNLSRKATDTNAVHRGIEIQGDVIPYTGKNVVVGIVDCGIQPSHIAFLTSDASSTRVKKYSITTGGYESDSNDFSVIIYDNPKDIMNAPSENLCGGHGTHVTGIAAGGYQNNDFYGMAPNAELVLTSMGEKIYEDEVFYGIQSAIEYANDKGLPVVVNLSLGSALGAHDGSGSLTEYLESIGKEGKIICFAAGNDGRGKISLSQNFSENPNILSTAFAKSITGTPPQKIYSQLWSIDKREFEVSFHVIDITQRTILYSTPYISKSLTNEASDDVIILSGSNGESLYPTLSHYFDGEILFATSIESNRYVSEIFCNFNNVDIETPYTLGISIKSDSGTEVIAICDNQHCYFRHFGINNFVNGNAEHSISDYCTSPYVISVGSWNSRQSWQDIDGISHSLNEESFGSLNEISMYSSYGKNLHSGELLPHVVAPGTEIIAPINKDAKDIDKATFVCHQEIYDGNTYQYGNMTGTSMAVPAVSGIIALWLEAKPDLTRDEILEVIRNTSIRDEYVETKHSQAGAGKIDAYNGLKYILTKMTHIVDSSIDDNLKVMMRYLNNNEIELIMSIPNIDGEIELYDLSGKLIQTQVFNGNTVRYITNADSGYYIMKISTKYGNNVQKVYIK